MLRIIPAQPNDAARFTAIAFAAKRHWGYPEEWIREWRDSLTITPESLARYPAFSAAKEPNQMLGFYLLRPEGNRVHLEHLWVVPTSMKQGLGRALFDHALGVAQAMGFQRLEIEADPYAGGFYLRMGATANGFTTSKVNGTPRALPCFTVDLTGRTEPSGTC